jgi:pyruvate/2-oxoglutarate dehydrogenase complex dihydrolipoamide acyltransferase (E2) component
MGDSITEGTLVAWHKKKGDFVLKDEQIATIGCLYLYNRLQISL